MEKISWKRKYLSLVWSDKTLNLELQEYKWHFILTYWLETQTSSHAKLWWKLCQNSYIFFWTALIFYQKQRCTVTQAWPCVGRCLKKLCMHNFPSIWWYTYNHTHCLTLFVAGVLLALSYLSSRWEFGARWASGLEKESKPFHEQNSDYSHCHGNRNQLWMLQLPIF